MEKEGKNMSEEMKNLNKKEMTEEELNKVAGGVTVYYDAYWQVGETRPTRSSFETKSGKRWRFKIVEGNYTLKIHGDWFAKLKPGPKFKIGNNKKIFELIGGSYNVGKDGLIEIGVPFIDGVAQKQDLIDIGNHPDITRVE